MKMPQLHIGELLVKHLNGKSDSEEERLVNEWINQSPANRAFYEGIRNKTSLKEKLEQFKSADPAIGWQAISAIIGEEIHQAPQIPVADLPPAGTSPDYSLPSRRIHFLRRALFRYAAAAILLFAIGAYLIINMQPESTGVATAQPVPAENDIAPGRDGAILTLADGTQLVLDSMGNGKIADQGGTRLLLNDGAVTYDGRHASTVTYNTMTTPRGRWFHLVLSDGSKVWLNAASSITYPTAFIGKERSVTISGEAYLEVAKNPERPFIVKVNDTISIEVLGTAFNVNAYKNEPAFTATLLEGIVQIKALGRSQMLKPGQQARIEHTIKVVDTVNLNQVTAWKNGYFDFDNADLFTVMRQLERWYNIDVTFAANVPDKQFRGKLPRELSLAQVLKIFDKIGVRFTIKEGRKLVVHQ